jgi:hypothetical protein
VRQQGAAPGQLGGRLLGLGPAASGEVDRVAAGGELAGDLPAGSPVGSGHHDDPVHPGPVSVRIAI